MTTKIIWGNFVQISQVPEISTVFLKETDFNIFKDVKTNKTFQKC